MKKSWAEITTRFPFAKSTIFSRFDEKDLQIFDKFLKKKKYTKGEMLIEEGAISSEIYFIVKGSLEVLKKVNENDYKKLTVVTEGQTAGEISFFDKKPRSASLYALEETMVYIATEQSLKKLSREYPECYQKFLFNIVRFLGKRLKQLNETVLADYRRQLAEEKERFFMSKFVTALLVLACVYVFALDFSQKTMSKSAAGAFVSLSILFIFVVFMVLFMFKSGYPMSYFGFTTKNWKRSLFEGIAFTVPFMLIILVLKWIVIQKYQLDEPIFNFYAPIKKGIEVANPIRFILLLQVLYVVSVLAQEVCARAGLHSALRIVLVGKHTEWKAIFLSNLVFGGSHIIMSINFAIFAFFPGIFWGWLYSRTNNLIAPVVSHFLIGYWALFVVGIQHAFQIT